MGAQRRHPAVIKGHPPQWAMDIIRAECRRKRLALPDISWRRRRAHHRWETSSGSAFAIGEDKDFPRGQVCLTAGRDRKDQKLVLCHELAHWEGPPDGQPHDLTFWGRAWEIYHLYGVPVNFALHREATLYGGRSRTAYNDMRRRMRS